MLGCRGLGCREPGDLGAEGPGDPGAGVQGTRVPRTWGPGCRGTWGPGCWGAGDPGAEGPGVRKGSIGGMSDGGYVKFCLMGKGEDSASMVVMEENDTNTFIANEKKER